MTKEHPMQIVLNGQTKDFSENLTVTQLLDSLGLAPELVVVELNRDILASEQFAATRLKNDDALEIVQFVGGG
jgi:thiamine biosynthesis protein ThiS